MAHLRRLELPPKNEDQGCSRHSASEPTRTLYYQSHVQRTAHLRRTRSPAPDRDWQYWVELHTRLTVISEMARYVTLGDDGNRLVRHNCSKNTGQVAGPALAGSGDCQTLHVVLLCSIACELQRYTGPSSSSSPEQCVLSH